MSKSLKAAVIVGLIIVSVVVLLRSANVGSQLLWRVSQQGQWLLPLVTISALLDSVNPCAFSILILTIAFLFSLGTNRSGILKIGGLYIAGIFVVYVLIGLGILQALHIFNTPHFMAKIGITLLILFGSINVINEYFPKFPIKLSIPHAAHGSIARLMEKASLPTAFALGALVGLCEFPCTGGPYLMVLGLLHDQGTYARGLGYLMFYNVIFILPLAVILLFASNRQLLGRVEEWKKNNNPKMRLWSGWAMIILGALLLLI